MSKHICSICGKSYKSRSGVWKHEQKCQVDSFEHTQSSVADETEPPMLASSNSESSDVAEDTPTSKWMDFDLGGGEVEYTDTPPAALKMVVAQGQKDRKKMSKQEEKTFKETEKAMLKMMLGGIDTVLTTYGKAVTLNPDFLVKHSESSKEMVSSAQYSWMEEKGLSLSKYANKGVLAASLTTWYIAAPVLRIKQEAKKPMLKRMGGGGRSLLSRLPLIGRIFKRKPKTSEDMFSIEDNGVDIE